MININIFGIKGLDFVSLGLWKWGIATLILFLLVYLVRPKPNEKMIPSLMFLISRRKKGKFNSFLRKLFRDPLFFIQLLLLTMLAVSLIGPYLIYKYDVASENTVLILDVSASMEPNFNNMIKEAKNKVKGETSVILVKRFPSLYFENENPDRAKELIEGIELSVSSSNIVDAIKKGNEILGNRTGRIYIMSDFVDTENNADDLLSYKRYLEGEGRIIDFIVMEENKDNIGFIQADYSNNRVSLAIKNYNEKEETITLKSGENKIDVKIEPNFVEIVKIDLEQGLNTITINRKDNIKADNKYYINIPTKKEMDVLLLTNKKDGYLIDFLTASPYINLEIVEPPKIPNVKHDAVIIYDVNTEMVLSKTRDDIVDYVNEGGALIIHSQNNLKSLVSKFSEVMPVEIDGERIQEAESKIEFEHDMTTDLSFSKVNNFYKTTIINGSVSLVTASKNPIIAYREINEGRVMYFGIDETQNEFKISANYPLFWNRGLRFLSSFNDFDTLNKLSYETGYDIKTGFYEKGHKTIAVNLLNVDESSINNDIEYFNTELKKDETQRDNFLDRNFDLLKIIIPLIILIAILEILFIKYRGDI
ncbi:MAG: VWA domain-containing protein [Patescibacteria group bacterium]|nr:VWA domain-containing protein [Patescibacteria group bacterium]